MKPRVIAAIFALLALGLLAIWLFVSPRLATQYLAPQLACACRDLTILEFSNGKVRLHLLAHTKYYEFGTYETIGNHVIWHLKDYGADFEVTPQFLGLYACNRQQRLAQFFPKSFRYIDTSQTKASTQSITNFLKKLSYGFNQIPSD